MEAGLNMPGVKSCNAVNMPGVKSCNAAFWEDARPSLQNCLAD